MYTKKYIGRQLRPSQLAAELLPSDQKWCAVCHQAIAKNILQEHYRSNGHRLAQRKLNRLKNISIAMWEKHRGSAVEMDSARENNITEEFARFRADQRLRDERARALHFARHQKQL